MKVLFFLTCVIVVISSNPWRPRGQEQDPDKMLRDIREYVLKTQSDINLILNMEKQTMEHLMDIEEDLEDLEDEKETKLSSHLSRNNEEDFIGDFLY